MLSIYFYATASTDSAAYIIGGASMMGDVGSPYITTIAEYKNNKWRKFGDLTNKKFCFSSIFLHEKYIFVGGIGDEGYVTH